MIINVREQKMKIASFIPIPFIISKKKLIYLHVLEHDSKDYQEFSSCSELVDY